MKYLIKPEYDLFWQQFMDWRETDHPTHNGKNFPEF